MEKLSDILNTRGVNLERELLKTEGCERCGNELKTYKMQLIGGPKKGKWATITEKCDCYLAQKVLEKVTKTKLDYFREHSTINDSLIHATLDNYSPSNNSQINAVKKAIDYISKISANEVARMIYYGSPGLGKSHLAIGIYKILDSHFHKSCMFIDVPTLKQMVKSSWSKDSAYSEGELMRAIAEADLLILDDVGAEGITPWAKELMFTILNTRLSKSLLITTNMSISEIYKEYGTKIADRFLENMSKQDILKLDGEHSYRIRNLIDELSN